MFCGAEIGSKKPKLITNCCNSTNPIWSTSSEIVVARAMNTGINAEARLVALANPR